MKNTDITTTTEKLAAQFAKVVPSHASRESRRVRRDDPRMTAYWERLAEDLLRTDEEWDALLAKTAEEASSQRVKVMAKLSASRYAR